LLNLHLLPLHIDHKGYGVGIIAIGLVEVSFGCIRHIEHVAAQNGEDAL